MTEPHLGPARRSPHRRARRRSGRRLDSGRHGPLHRLPERRRCRAARRPCLPDRRAARRAHRSVITGSSSTQTGYFEGAQWATDTARIAVDQTQPGERVRRVVVQVLRTIPELWICAAPRFGRPARRRRDARRGAVCRSDGATARRRPRPVRRAGLRRLGVRVRSAGRPRQHHRDLRRGDEDVLRDLPALQPLRDRGRARAAGRTCPQHAGAWSSTPRVRISCISTGRTQSLRRGEPRALGALGVPTPGPFTNVDIFVPRQRVPQACGRP